MGNDAARSGTTVSPAGPPVRLNPSRPSLVIVTTCQLSKRKAAPGSIESKASRPCDTTRSVPPRWLASDPTAPTQRRVPSGARLTGSLSIRVVRLTLPVRVSMSVRVPLRVLPLQSPSAPYASSCGAAGIAILVTEPEPTSTFETVRSGRLATQTAPPPTVTPTGPLPTGIAWTTWFRTGSTRRSSPDSSLVTQRLPRPYAIRLGVWSSRIVA